MNPHKIASSTLGIIVFILGIALLVYTFAIALTSLSRPIPMSEPSEIASYLVSLLKNIAYLFVMGMCGTLIAIMGIKMYQGSG
ncbi:hypothetical protein H5T88_00885 [bacterium]|nr:hypothetical protein [bacterium]